jgi:hypothetical protein
MLVHDNAGGAVQRKPHFLQNEEGGTKGQVGRNVFSHVDDIVVARKKKASYIFDLSELSPICAKPSSSSIWRSVSSA